MKPPSTIPGYRLVRELGRGGMATVYLAVQESLQREVALKLLDPQLAADPVASERFLREGRIAAKLVHRHIVGIHDVGVADGQPYMAMEYMPKGTLSGGDPRPPAEVLTILREVALALDHAHAQGVVHRDIKPENIMCRADGSHALSDFGIARTTDHGAPMTQEGATVGTPHYMSPEQLQGQAVDGRADLYSLGVVLHELLTGQMPYQGTDSWSIGVQHISAPLPRLQPALVRFQPLLDALMAKSPVQRPQSGAELARRIDALQKRPSPTAAVFGSPSPQRAPLMPTGVVPALGGARALLSQRAFPRRIAALLEGVLEHVPVEFDQRLATALDEFEKHLLKTAEQARGNAEQQNALETLHAFKRGRSRLIPRFLQGMEASLAALKDPPQRDRFVQGVRTDGQLSLIEDVMLDEAGTLNEIAGRTEIRNSLALFLLGQRFGAIAGKAAFDAETLPIGPHAICRALRDAVGCLDLAPEPRLQLYRQFDRSVLQHVDPLFESLNTFLSDKGVLPHLTYIPLRGRPSAQAERAGPRDTPTATPPPAAQRDVERFAQAQQLMSDRRAALDTASDAEPDVEATHVASRDDVQSALGQLQAQTPAPAEIDGTLQARSPDDLKQDMLKQLRQLIQVEAPTLATEERDTIDLVGMLFDQIMKDLRPNSLASTLLGKLQVPLLRVALNDKAFFTEKAHPARQMLNTIAESGAYWSREDEADRNVSDTMQLTVDRVRRDFSGDPTLFDAALGDLTAHLQTQARKAEVAERRHVEAARGKEKLELARLKAAEAIDVRLAGKRVPKFLHSLLALAWSDVLALSLLRGGEQSEGYLRQLQVAARLIEAAAGRAAGAEPISSAEAQSLRQEIEEALAQVGYYAHDAQAIAQRVLAGGDEEEDDPASRTELAMTLRTGARLGQYHEAQAPNSVVPLDAAEQAWLDRLRQLPFGTWFAFKQGDEIVRHRLAWYSTQTDNCLFVTHRGQRVGGHSLAWLARELQRGEAHVLEAETESAIDRAWTGTLSSLRAFVDRGALPSS